MDCDEEDPFYAYLIPERDKIGIIQANWLDLINYDSSRFVTKNGMYVKFKTEQETKEWINRHYERNCIDDDCITSRISKENNNDAGRLKMVKIIKK